MSSDGAASMESAGAQNAAIASTSVSYAFRIVFSFVDRRMFLM